MNNSFSGKILLVYDLYSRSPNDPNFDSGAGSISLGNTVTADASVTVVRKYGRVECLRNPVVC